MTEQTSLSKRSMIDFSYMFISNIFKKLLGFFREMILAYFFGSSITYANFLLLRTVTDFFSQFTFGSAMQANLLPKFTKMYTNNSSIDLSTASRFISRFSIKIFFISQFLQIPMIWYINPENKLLFFCLSIILGFLVAINFFNSVFLIVFQAKGDFKQYSISTTINLFLATIVLYPLSLIFSLIGIVLSRLIGVLTLSFVYIKALIEEKGEEELILQKSDFNLAVIFLGNLANIIILIGRFSSGIGHSVDITYFTYSVVLLNILLTAVIMNINTLVLRLITIKKGLFLVFVSAILSFLIGVLMLFFIDRFDTQIISFIFERGVFSSSDTINTTFYLQKLGWSFMSLFIATSLIQPFFTLKEQILRRESKWLASFFVLLVMMIFFVLRYFNIESRDFTIYFMLCMSCAYLLVSVISLIRYRYHEN